MTTTNTNATTTGVKVWFMSPHSTTIETRRVPTYRAYNAFKELLCCERVEWQGFRTLDGRDYCVIMDEEGSFKNTLPNKIAKRLIGKVKNILWGEFTGNWVVVQYIDMGKDTEHLGDMDLTPTEFITLFNRAMAR